MNRVNVKEFGLDVLYRHDYNRKGNEINKYVKKSCEYLDEFLDNVVGSENFKTFIDIGSNDTSSLDFFKDKFTCIGVDKYPSVEDSRILVKDFYNLSEYVEKVDVVFCNHTLEHSLAPLLLEQISKVHNVGGVIFIAVPDADYPWSYEITSSTTHWSIFNEGFLRTLLTRYGYECVIEKKCFRDNKGELFAVGIKRF